MKAKLYLLLFSLFWAANVQSQCAGAGSNCFDIEPSCFPVSGILSTNQLTEPFPGCPANTLDNPAWYAVEVLSAGTVVVTITPRNCPGTNGVTGAQSGFYLNCDPASPPFGVQCGCTMGAMTHAATVDTGTYFILVDGCAGDECEYDIAVFGDIAAPAFSDTLPPPEVVPLDPCPGEIVQITAPDFPTIESWNWTLPTGAVIVSDPPFCSDISVIWGSNSGTVSYQVDNDCIDPVTSPTTSVVVATLTAEETVFYCEDDGPGYFHPGSQTFWPAGSWEIPLFTTRGCDSIVTLIVTAYPSASSVISETVCQGATLSQYPELPSPINESLDTTIRIPLGASSGFCDSIINFQIVVYQDQPVISFEKLDCSVNGGQIQLSVPDEPGSTFNWTTSNGNIVSATNESTLVVDAVGEYTVDVQIDDGNLVCTGQSTISLGSEDFSIVEISPVITNVSCAGGVDGSIVVSPSGGSGGYTYEWANSSLETDQLNNLSVGTYSVTVTAANSCTAEATFTVESPDELVASNVDVTAVCDGTGTVTVDVVGGVTPYFYSWSNGSTTIPTTEYPAGTHTVTVTDANDCTLEVSFVVLPAIDFELGSTFVNCDSTGGSASVTNVTGSSNPLITWSTGDQGAFITGLQPGGYSVTVEDPGSGCRNHKNVMVELDTACVVVISGFVYDDQAVPDCIIDAGTRPARNMQVELSTGMIVFTDDDGYYEFQVPPGEYSLQLNTMGSNVQSICTDPILVDARVWGVPYDNNNFFVQVNSQVDLFMKIVKFNQRPGFARPIRICVMNRGADPADGTLYFTHDSLQTFSSAFPMESSYSLPNREVAFNFTDLRPGQVYVYTVNMFTPLTTTAGTVVNYHFLVEPSNGIDVNFADNEESCSTVVTNSYDPNDKLVTPMGRGAEGLLVPTDTMLSYQVRFQNTGTDTAYTVVIRDLIDEDLQIRSLRPIAASHDYTACILPEGILEVVFDNIFLPDSTTNFEASNGFVVFDIELEKALPLGTTIENTAGIYFDFNAPIITNTVVNTVGAFDVFTEQTLRGCGSVVVNDVAYTTDTTLQEVFNLPYNDSTATTHLEILPVFDVTIDTTLSKGDEYLGQTIASDTTIVQNLSSIDGCDSVVTTNIMVILTNTSTLDKAFEILVHPNPFRQYVRFQLNGTAPSQPMLQVRVFDSQGRLLRNQRHRGTDFYCYTADWPSGLYYYELSVDGQVVERSKLVKE
ncbi:MAG: T9SS type A sorting domain-containing protein [Bacteroidota bacterium]